MGIIVSLINKPKSHQQEAEWGQQRWTIKCFYKIARLIFICFSVIISPFAFGDTNGDQNATSQS